MSDRRLKTDIHRVGSSTTAPPSTPTASRVRRALQFGVMADEVREVLPEAVRDIDGALHVDYDRVSRHAREAA